MNRFHVFACLAAMTLVATPIDAALLGHWRFDDPENLGLDSAGGDNNGTDIGESDTAFSANARVGAGALEITGLETGLELANSTDFQPLTTFTIAAFVNADRDNGTFGVGRVFSSLRTPTGDLTNGNNGYGFAVLSNGRLRYTTFGIQDYDTSAGTVVPIDSWAHVAVVVTEGSAKFFVNGATVQTIVGGNPAPNSDPFHIGAGSVFATDPFAGLIDDVRVYDEALPDATIATLAAAPQAGFHAQINRISGQLTLTNSATASRVISRVDVASAAGGLNAPGWLSIAGNYDANSGTGSVDPNDVWEETSRTATSLSEQTLGSATIAPAQIVNYGPAWLKSPFEDVSVSVLLGDGTTFNLPVDFVGNDNAPFAIGDLNFDGAIDAIDWPIYRNGYGNDLTGLSAVQSYRQGDLNSDGANNVVDFGIFKTAYDDANGVGSFEAMAGAVPEPATWALLAIGGALLASRRAPQPACRAVSALIAVAALAAPSEATLLGHWRFEDAGNLGLDSAGGDNNGVGGADATASANSAIGIGALKLTGAGTGLQVASPETFQSLTTFTIAAFVNADLDDPAFGFVGRPFSSLSTPVGGSNDGYGFGVLKSGGLRYTTYGIQDYDQPATVQADVWTHVAVVVTEGSAEFFVDGTSFGFIGGGNPAPTSHPFHIGAGAVFATDPYRGFIDELRVYDEAIDAAGIASLAAAFAPVRLTLEVNTTTGATRIFNNTGAAFSIDQYEIASPGDALNAAGWRSLQNFPIGGFPAGTGAGNGWEKLGTPDSDLLAEGFLQGSSNFTNSLSIDLGTAYNTAVNDPNIEFRYRLASGDVLDGTVSYVTGGFLAADFNNSTAVNGADLALWKAGYGDTTAVKTDGDADADQDVDGADFLVWQRQSGRTTAAIPAGAAVPEPTSLALLVLTGIASALGARGHRQRSA